MWDNKNLWKNKYRNEQGSLTRDIFVPDHGDFDTTFEVVFDFDGERYYCYIDANTVEEALGRFFRLHENVTYNHVVDHFEI